DKNIIFEMRIKLKTRIVILKTHFMKKLLLLPLLILLAFSELTAQVTVSLGTYTGAGSTNVLLSTSTTANRYSRTISVYTAAEIIAAGGMSGNITSLAWSKSGNGEYLTNDAY